MLRRAWVIAVLVPLATFLFLLLACMLINAMYDRLPITLSVAGQTHAPANLGAGTGSYLQDSTYFLRLDKNGRGIVHASLSQNATLKLYFLQITFLADDPRTRLLIFGRTEDAADGTSIATLAPGDGLQRVYLSAAHTQHGPTQGFIFGFQGPVGAEVELGLGPLLPYSPWHHVKDAASRIAAVSPWTITSINNYADPGRLMSAPPLVLSLGSLVAVALGLLGIACRLGLSKSTALHSLVLLFVLCWGLLDLNWLHQQRHNAREALKAFSGKAEHDRLQASTDAVVHRFSERVHAQIRPSDNVPAIFVASTSDYAGMRMAYFLYPLNVYWERLEELPAQSSFESGDHILVVNPTSHRYVDGYITYPDRSDRIAAELLFSEPLGALFRVR